MEVAGQPYNSLQKAYDAITGDSGTIKVTSSTAIEAVLPASPEGKNITFDLNGKELTIAQPLINSATMSIVDSDPGKTGRLHSSNATVEAVRNNGTLTIESTYVSGDGTAITNTANSTTLNINNSHIHGNSVAISSTGTTSANNIININGNSVVSSNHTGVSSSNTKTYVKDTSKISVTNSDSSAIYGISGGTNYLQGGSIEVSKTTSNGAVYGISSSGTTTVDSGSITVSSLGSVTNGISSNYTTMNDGSITVTSSGSNEIDAIVVSAKSGTANVVKGNITVSNAGSGSAIGIKGAIWGKITVEKDVNIAATNTGTGYAYGIYAGGASTTTFNGGTITATSNGSSATGILGNPSCGWNASGYGDVYVTGGTITVHAKTVSNGLYGSETCTTEGGSKRDSRTFVSGGTIVATSDEGTSYGIRASTNEISGNTSVSGGTYGIYTYLTTTIGANDGELSDTEPEIIGGSYALYNGIAYFYDGVLRGAIAAYQDGVIKQIADNSTIYKTIQEISGTNYEICYLVEEHYVAAIGEAKYKQLSAAIAAANPGETIDLLEDNYAYYPITISGEKTFTIKTNGFKIYQGYSITNNGNVSIEGNASVLTPTISYYSSGYAFVNNADATLTLKNININSLYGINNSGALNIDNVSITAQYTAINNSGDTTSRNNINLSGNDYPIYNNGGTSSIKDATLTGKYIYNNSGTLSLTNSTSQKTNTDKTVYTYTTNKGTLELQSTQITLVETDATNSSTAHHRAIYNTGTLISSANSTISHTINSSDKNLSGEASTIYNDGGQIEIEDTTITFDATNVRNNYSYNTYGIYSPSSDTTLKSGSISAIGRGKVYGIFTNTGTITLGIPEQENSSGYGRDTADVKLDDPSITAISTSTTSSYKTAIGVKNNSGGKVYYYDGKVAGLTASFTENLTGTEYLYEPCTELDTSVTPNLYTTHLFWMRDGQSTCANN